MTSLLRSILVVLALLVVPTHAQFAAGGTTGGKNRVSSGFDTTEFAAATVIELNAAKTKVRMIDTTVTSTSVSRIVAFNLHDPNQLGRYNAAGELVSAFDEFRTAELSGSIWRTEGLLHPAQGWGIVTAGQDTVSIWDGLNMTKVLAYNPGANNALQDATPVVTDLAFLDGVWWLTGTGGAARLTSRNAGSGWTTMSTTPATVSATDYAIAVMRGVFSGLAGVDQFGRQRPYWTVGTIGGATTRIWDADASPLYLYDTSSVDSWGIAFARTDNGLIGVLSEATRDKIVWRYAPTSITADAWAADETWANNETGSEDLRWGNATVITYVDALNGASGSGRNSYRFYATADSGLYILDAKASDNTNGSKQEITNKYVSPVMPGSTVIAFAGASAANVAASSNPGFTVTGAVEYTSSSSVPGSHYVTFNSASEGLAVADQADFAMTTTMSMGVWFHQTSDPAGDKGLFDQYDSDFTSLQAYAIYISDAGNAPTFTIRDAGGQTSVAGPAISSNVWYYAVGTYDGATIRLYLNGALVASAAETGTIQDSGTNLALGCFMSSGAAALGFPGYISGAFLSSSVMSAQQIVDAYGSGLALINSPYPDTLYTASQHRVNINPISGQFLLMDTTRTTSVVEIRDKHGALIDTLVCTGCGRGRDADFISIPGIDSTAVVFGGTLGYRVVTPDPRVVALAQASWPTHGARYIGSGPAILDSTGHGDFWTLNDAVAALNNVGQNLVQVLRGTYPAATISQDGMTVEGAGDTLSVFDGLAAAAGLTISGADVTVRNLGARTTPGGGSAFDAWSITGARFNGEYLRALGSDDDCFVLGASILSLANIRAHRCDDDGLNFGVSLNSRITGEVQNQSGDAVEIGSSANNNLIGPIRTDGAIKDAGAGTVIISQETAY